MGRALLFIAMMVGAIYGGMILRLQNRILKLPEVKVEHLVQKEAESVSDFVLRAAIKNAGTWGVLDLDASNPTITKTFDDYTIGHVTIQSIEFTRLAENQYKAVTNVTGNLMGKQVTHPAEIAFDLTVSNTWEPNLFYYQIDIPQFNPHFNTVPDSSPHGNHGAPNGTMRTRPRSVGSRGWKSAQFGPNNGTNTNAYIDFPGSTSTVVSTQFTLIAYAQIARGSTTGTLIWMPSDPYDTNTASGSHPGQNLRYKPTGAIWYENNRIYYSATTENYEQLTVTTPFTPSARHPYNDDDLWVYFALTYNSGVLKAYMDGNLVGTATANTPAAAMPSDYGFTLGRRDLRPEGNYSRSDFQYLTGLMEHIGMYNRALSPAEIQGVNSNIYGLGTGTGFTSIGNAEIKYIRD